MLRKLDKRENTTVIDLEPNEGERTLLSSNKSGTRSPSLDLEELEHASQDELIGMLAEILMEAFIWQHEHRSD